MNSKSRKSYFDGLPVEALENVFRFTSEKPRHSNWIAYVNPNSLLALFGCNPEIRECIRQRVQSLEVTEQVPDERRCLLLAGAGEQNRNLFPKLTNALGSVLSEVRISRSTFPWGWQRALVLHCGQMRRLSLATTASGGAVPLRDILHFAGTILEELDIRFHSLVMSDVLAIAMHSKRLRRLSLVVDRVDLSVDLKWIWRSPGVALTEVRLGVMGRMGIAGIQRLALPSLAQRCRELRKISFVRVPASMHTLVTEVCIGYGAQLELLGLQECDFDAENIARITSACPKARYDVWEDLGCTAGALCQMGANAMRVNIGRNTFVPSGGPMEIEAQLELATEKCCNLESITLWDTYPYAGAFHALFIHPKKHLREFKANFLSIDLANSVLDMVSKCIFSVEFLELRSPLSGSSLQKVAAASPRLTKVHLMALASPNLCNCIIYNSKELYELDDEEHWGNVVKSFLRCPLLFEMELSCEWVIKSGIIPEFGEACLAARQNRNCRPFACK